MDFLIGIVAQTALLKESYEGYDESTRVFAAVEVNNFYGKAGYESGSFQLIGQPWFKTDSVTAGLGYRFELSEAFSLTFEGGYWHPTKAEIDAAVRDEVAFTYLTQRHTANGTKPIPLPQVTTDVFGIPMTNYAPCSEWGGEFFPNDCYESEATIDGAVYADVGVTAEVYSGLELGLSYRHLRPNSSIAIFHPETRANGGGYWREDGVLNYDTVNFTIQWRF